VLNARRGITQLLWDADMPPYDLLPVVSDVYTAQSTTFPTELTGIAPSLVQSIQRFDLEVGHDFHLSSYLIHPAADGPAHRLAIVHQGHSSFENRWEGGVGSLAEYLLTAGISVLAMQMPQRGWNRDNTILVDGQDVFIGTAHSELFRLLEDDGEALRLFVEPVVAGINAFLELQPGVEDISMLGLSGGGWTTHLAAAIDPRIRLSIPVAGAVPLGLRSAYPYFNGDGEQLAAGLYESVATYLDLFVLAAYGENRRQIQILNQFDTCCFYGIGHETYVDEVRRAMQGLGQGQWQFVLDSTHEGHQISPFAIEQVIGPALLIPEPSGLPLILLALVIFPSVARIDRHYGRSALRNRGR
jgi:hypothetical protein